MVRIFQWAIFVGWVMIGLGTMAFREAIGA